MYVQSSHPYINAVLATPPTKMFQLKFRKRWKSIYAKGLLKNPFWSKKWGPQPLKPNPLAEKLI